MILRLGNKTFLPLGLYALEMLRHCSHSGDPIRRTCQKPRVHRSGRNETLGNFVPPPGRGSFASPSSYSHPVQPTALHFSSFKTSQNGFTFAASVTASGHSQHTASTTTVARSQ